VRFGVLGDPIAHSKSPVMHEGAYRALGMPHTYEAIRATRDELAGFADGVRRGEWDGLNVTVPHKEAILEHVDEVDESARAVSAANTLVRAKGGRVVAYNTDVPALAAEVRALAPDITDEEWRGAAGIILGSGGVARSAVASLAAHLHLRVIVVRARAFDEDASCTQFRRAVAGALGKTTLVTAPLSLGGAREPEEAHALVVIQATSAGMTGKDAGEDVATAVDFASLPARAVAVDVVYAPPRTPFVVAAEKAGIRATNGLGMLARQGALAFELWLHVPAPYNAMLAAIT
jgi:shikimate dehydrogenase